MCESCARGVPGTERAGDYCSTSTVIQLLSCPTNERAAGGRKKQNVRSCNGYFFLLILVAKVISRPT